MAIAIDSSPLAIYHMTEERAIPQGTDWPVDITYQEPPGTPFVFTTYTAKLQVKQTYDGPVLLELNTSNGGITLSDGAGGTPNVRLLFPANGTYAMTVYTDMIYDIEFVSTTGLIKRFIKGQFALDRNVSR